MNIIHGYVDMRDGSIVSVNVSIKYAGTFNGRQTCSVSKHANMQEDVMKILKKLKLRKFYIKDNNNNNIIIITITFIGP